MLKSIYHPTESTLSFKLSQYPQKSTQMKNELKQICTGHIFHKKFLYYVVDLLYMHQHTK